MKLKKYETIYRLMFREGLEHLGEDGIECVAIVCKKCKGITETSFIDFPKEGTKVSLDCGCYDEITIEYKEVNHE